MATSVRGPPRKGYISFGCLISPLLQNTYNFAGIKNPARVVKSANEGMSVVTRNSLNGKCVMAISQEAIFYTNNQRLNHDNSNSTNCTKHSCKCSFLETHHWKEGAASEDKSKLLGNLKTEFDVELLWNAAEFSSPDGKSPSSPKTEILHTEELHISDLISSITPRTHNAVEVPILKPQIPLSVRHVCNAKIH
jgi:hypothetical protein